MKEGTNLKIITPFLVLILVLSIVGISGCTSEKSKTPFYQGEWKVGTNHFVVKQDLIDAFAGSYKAYKENGTIILEGTGTQMSISNDTAHNIKIIMKQQGPDVNTTYYLDGKIHSYDTTKNFTVDEVFDLTVKIWELRRTTAEENRTMVMDERTETVKI